MELARFQRNASDQLMAKNASAVIWILELVLNVAVIVLNNNQLIRLINELSKYDI